MMRLTLLTLFCLLCTFSYSQNNDCADAIVICGDEDIMDNPNGAGIDDFADPDKILAVLPGGVTGRQFDPHTTDQVEPFMNGGKVYWWFSDSAIKEHTEHTLTLNP